LVKRFFLKIFFRNPFFEAQKLRSLWYYLMRIVGWMIDNVYIMPADYGFPTPQLERLWLWLDLCQI
jgi:hypothetical protein